MSEQLEEFNNFLSKSNVQVTDELIDKVTRENIMLEDFSQLESIDPRMRNLVSDLNNYEGKLGVQTVYSCEGHITTELGDSLSYLALIPTKEEDLVWVALAKAMDIFTVEEILESSPSLERMYLNNFSIGEDVIYPAFIIRFGGAKDQEHLDHIHDLWDRYVYRIIQIFEEYNE